MVASLHSSQVSTHLSHRVSERKVNRHGPSVTVIIPTFNSEESIERAIQSAKACNTMEVDVIVIDGGSSDSTRKIATHCGVRVLDGSYPRATARRVGASIARGDYVIFLDSDQTFQLGSIERCVREAESRDLCAVKLPELVTGSGVWVDCVRLESTLVLQIEDLTYPRFFRKSCYSSLGGHRYGLEDYMEDRDLFLRFKNAGMRWGWSPIGIENRFDRRRVFQRALARTKASRDAEVFYGENPESPFDVVVPRLRALDHLIRSRRTNRLTLLCYPFFVVIAHGPRFLIASLKWLTVRIS
jgi:glycosyltransferase involved in cell wall biosynthesis